MECRKYTGGSIITMEGIRGDQRAETLVTRGGEIVYVGPAEGANAFGDALEIPLRGRALLPAFIDSHSHFAGSAIARLQLSLGGVGSYKALKERVREWIESERLEPGEWVNARGYDVFGEGAHPTQEILDEAAPDFPMVAQHASGHMGVFNSAALRALGESGSGYREEAEFLRLLARMPQPPADRWIQALAAAQEEYFSHGIALAQEGLVNAQLAALYAQAGPLTIPVYGYVDARNADALLAAFPANLRLGGYKILLDGSPQGGTAWMRGEGMARAALTDEQVDSFARRAARENVQILAHCNGDAACDQWIDSVKRVGGLKRPVAVHAQFCPRERLAEMREWDIVPSFFVAHTYHWGDAHIRRFGFERASAISPLRSALHAGLEFTLHQDSPVIPPDMLETVWCAVNRRTKEGILLGGDETIDVESALRAVTLHAARQYFLEEKTGTLAVGKRADMVVVSRDPLSIDPIQVRNIRVEETILAGKTVWLRPQKEA